LELQVQEAILASLVHREQRVLRVSQDSEGKMASREKLVHKVQLDSRALTAALEALVTLAARARRVSVVHVALPDQQA